MPFGIFPRGHDTRAAPTIRAGRDGRKRALARANGSKTKSGKNEKKIEFGRMEMNISPMTDVKINY